MFCTLKDIKTKITYVFSSACLVLLNFSIAEKF